VAHLLLFLIHERFTRITLVLLIGPNLIFRRATKKSRERQLAIKAEDCHMQREIT